ncbi:MAG: aldose 1-epimerase family protein [Chitinophagaceae bacterium]
MVTLDNGKLRVKIAEKGAELQELFSIAEGINFIWSGDPAYWGKFSPVLFPIVGTLRDNNFSHNGNTYSLSRHGFARDKVFTVEHTSANECSLLLSSDEDTLKVYPFHFHFRIKYSIGSDTLNVQYEVENSGAENMYFSVGAHPAFAVPFLPGTTYTDYALFFGKQVTAERWPITADGLIAGKPVSLLEQSSSLPLSHQLFEKDALVFKQFPSDTISIRPLKGGPQLELTWKDFPFLGIWAAKNADFVCIEPWCGIADASKAGGEIAAKEGIEKLEPGNVFSRGWQVRIIPG